MEEIQLINKYGVTLRKLTYAKIELVRFWRTHPKIAKFMTYQGNITLEQQEIWFQKINNSGKDFYFIIEVDDKEIGVINIKDVDFVKSEGEPGIFIWDDDYLDSDFSFRASLCLNDFVFYDLKLEKMRAHVLADNKNAVKFNKFWGFKLSSNQENAVIHEYTLEKKEYEEVKKRIEKLFKN